MQFERVKNTIGEWENFITEQFKLSPLVELRSGPPHNFTTLLPFELRIPRK